MPHLNPFTAAHPAGPLAPAHANPLLGAGAFAPRAFGAPALGDTSARVAGQVFGGRGGSALVPTGVVPGTYTSVTVDLYGRVLAGTNPSTGLDITGLTATDPADADEVPVYDASASANRKVTLQRLLGLAAIRPGGRLTDSASDPYFSGGGGSTIYYLPVDHARLPLWDGTRWLNVGYSDSGLSLALSGLTANLPYDVFVYSNSGTATLELTAWSSDTARVTGVSIQDGRYCKAGDKTRLYLGTLYTSGSNSVTRSISQEPFWNMYNRVLRELYTSQLASSYSYASATWRAANASTSMRCSFVRGLNADAVVAAVRANTTGTSCAGSVGIGLDRTNGNDALERAEAGHSTTDATIVLNTHARYTGRPAVGRHYLQWVESARAGTITFRHDTVNNCLQAEVWA